ncbi:MAG TPA: hypothetical protein VJ044_18035, partial [Candidatus Hodarchaeales archaeon]|nr:hypothetical protein [Candidatus Hodarchaeales archaeon]
NAVAFCTAVERICQVQLSTRAKQLRTLLLEVERIYSLLSDVGGMIVDVAYSVGAVEFQILREQMLRFNAKITGSRFLKRTLALGGLNFDLSPTNIKELTDYLPNFLKRFKSAINFCLSSTSVIDRLMTTGIVKKHLLKPLHLTGPIARSVGAPNDTRKDHPYLWYPYTKFKLQHESDGDVLSRFKLKASEIINACEIVLDIGSSLHEGEIKSSFAIKDGFAASLIEGPRGQNFVWVAIKRGKVERFKVRTASFNGWQAIQHAVLGNIVPDFPLINKSMNFSYAGTDL